MSDWTKDQEKCIFSHGGTMLVSAAAGSGKTSVLVQRIVERITHPEHPLDVDRLLVVTFTRAAAAEMKSRLAKALAERVQERPDDLNLLRQQMLLPRAHIGTVDSFCGELVRQNFHLLNIPPQFRVAEEQQLTLLKTEALNETLDECFAEGNEAFAELAEMLSNGQNDNALMSLIEQIAKFLEPHPDSDAWLDTMVDAYRDADSLGNTPFGKRALDLASETLRHAEDLCHTALSLASGDAVLNERYRPMLNDDLSFIVRARECCDMDSWDALAALLDSYAPMRLDGHTKGADDTLKARVQALRNTVKGAIADTAALIGGDEQSELQDIAVTRRMAYTLYDAVRRFVKKFRDKKWEARLLGFSDVAHLALELLTEEDRHTPSPLARELAERYDEILMDEYQDTNELQDAIFSALSKNEQNMFFVGDVKQSIYAFRQAMPKLFLNRRNRYPLFDGMHYPATVILKNNFRSRAQVTEAVNYVFRQLMTEKVGGLQYDEHEQLFCSAKYDDGDGYTPEVLISETCDEYGNKLPANVADAETVAARIAALVGSMTVSDKKLGSRPLRYGDCCILLRNRTPEYREALERRGIPVVADDAGAFFDTAEIRLALSILRCIDNPLLDVPLTAWLVSPLCGFTPDNLSAVAACCPHNALYTALCAARKTTAEPLASQCRRAVEFLDRYRTLSCQLTVDQLVRRLYEDTALPELMSARTDGERRRANLQILQDTCAQFDQSGFRGLSAFIRYVDRLQAQGIELPGAASTAGGDAVQICTIHKSKGLEYPVVFLACMHHPFSTQYLRSDLLLHPSLGAGIKRRDPVTRKKYRTLPYRLLAQTVADDQREEELRLLYVAMTRAREKLFLTMAYSDPDKTLSGVAALLDASPTVSPFTVRRAASMGEWALLSLLRHPAAAAWRHRIGCDDLPLLWDENPWDLKIVTPRAIETSACDFNEETIAPDPQTVNSLRERMNYRYPHEALARIPAKAAASGTAHGTVERHFVAHAQPMFTKKIGLTPAERGTAMHAFMQHADYVRASGDVTAEIRRVQQSGFLTEQQAAALDKKKLTAFFGSPLYARMVRSPRLLREYPFTTLQSAARWDPAVDGNELLVIQGMTDCVFEEDGALVIVDYKTDRVNGADELLARYQSQLNIYREALEQAMAMPVKECVLYSFALGCSVTVPLQT